MLPFIEGSLGDGTSGLVAVSRDSAVALVVKSTLRASLLKVATRTAVARMWLVIAETPSGHCLMGAHAY